MAYDPTNDPVQQFLATNANPNVSQPTNTTGDPVQDFLVSKGDGTPAVDEPTGRYIWNTVTNIPKSAVNMLSGIGSAIMHPIDTAENVGKLVIGEGEALTGKLASAINPSLTSAPSDREQLANQVNSFYKERYGSAQGFKDALEKDPVGVAADLSTVLGVSGKAAKLGNLGKTANALSTASEMTNPVGLAIKAGGAILPKVGNGVSNVLGSTMFTGAGGENIAMAFKSGQLGDKTFWEHLTQEKSPSEIVDLAKQGIANIIKDRGDNYRQNMAAVAQDKTPLDMQPIKDVMAKQSEVGTFKGQVTEPSTVPIKAQLGKIIDDWDMLDPAEYHTVEGFDALKKQIGDVRDGLEFGTPERLVADRVYNSVRGEISKQSPAYGAAMEQYAKTSQELQEIQRTLSLGEKSSTDTALRKLQSVARNNANTNYGNRLDLVKALEQQGGKSILPAIAGQSLNSWTGRGFAALSPTILGGAAAGASNPALMLAAPLMMPKAVGATAYGLGKGVSLLKQAGSKTGIKAKDLSNIGLALNVAAKANQ